MVVIDATILLLFFQPDAGVPVDDSGRPIDHPKDRIQPLISDLEKTATKIIIPSPVLSEILVRAGADESQQIVEEINKIATFRIEPFDTRAAIELATMTRSELRGVTKKKRDTSLTYAKLKFDRQIVAIAKVTQATAVYSDDRDLRAVARKAGISVFGLGDLHLPPETAQRELPLLPPRNTDDEDPPA